MKKIINNMKKMSREDALFLFVMFAFALVAFALVGGYLRRIDADIASWLIFSGIFAAAVGSAGILVKNDFFIHDYKK